MIGNESVGLGSLANLDMSQVGRLEQFAKDAPKLDDRIQEVAEQFEEVFMSLILKQMRSSLSEGLFSGDKSDVYGGMFDMYMSQALASSRQLGIASAIERYFQNQQASEEVGPENGKSKPSGD